MPVPISAPITREAMEPWPSRNFGLPRSVWPFWGLWLAGAAGPSGKGQGSRKTPSPNFPIISRSRYFFGAGSLILYFFRSDFTRKSAS